MSDPQPSSSSATPAIPASTPTTQAAVTFDRWWLGLQSMPADPSAPISVMITLRKYGYDATGTPVFDPNTQPVVFRVPDLMAEAELNPLVGPAFQAVLDAAASMAQARGLL
jgi:hypothetical protein